MYWEMSEHIFAESKQAELAYVLSEFEFGKGSGKSRILSWQKSGNPVHWIVRLHYYGFPINEGIGLILVIQTYPSSLSVLYTKDVYPTSSIV